MWTVGKVSAVVTILNFVGDSANRDVKELHRLFQIAVNTMVLAQHIYAFLFESRT